MAGSHRYRRWEEGSITWARTVNGRTVYYLTYSANNYATSEYGVGYATAPDGPWLRLTYQRQLADGGYRNVVNTGPGTDQPVTVVVGVTVRGPGTG